MTPKEIVEKFANALGQFNPIDRQPSNADLMRIQEVVAPPLLLIPYDETGGTHILIDLTRPVAAYATRYGAESIEPTRVGAYNVKIDDNATDIVRAGT